MHRRMGITVASVLLATVLGTLYATTVASADDQGRGRGKGNGGKESSHDREDRREGDRDRRGDDRKGGTSVHVVYSTTEVQVIREHYRPKYRNLPPGLQKKYERTGQLPPGWQKKVEPFPVELERRLPPLPPDHRRGVFDGHAVIYNQRTGLMIDLSVLF